MTHTGRFVSCLLAVSFVIFSANAQASTPDPELSAGFQAMYSLDFVSSERHLATYVHQKPDDPLGYAAQAACVLFTELNRLKALDAEFYVDDKKLFADPSGTPDPAAKKRLLELTEHTRQLADPLKSRETSRENALFALALANGVEADYMFLIEKRRLAAAKPGVKGYEAAKQLLETNPEFFDAYIWTGVTNYVVATLPMPIRWVARLRGYPASKEDAVGNLKLAAENGTLLKPYAKILLAVTYLRENKKAAAQTVIAELSTEFPTNSLFAKHASRLAH